MAVAKSPFVTYWCPLRKPSLLTAKLQLTFLPDMETLRQPAFLETELFYPSNFPSNFSGMASRKRVNCIVALR